MSSPPTLLIPPIATDWQAWRDIVVKDEKAFVLKYLAQERNYSGSRIIVKIHKYQVFRYEAALQHGANELLKLDLPCQFPSTFRDVIVRYGYTYDDYPSFWRLAVTRCMLGYVQLVVAEYGNNTGTFASELMRMIADDYEESAECNRVTSAVASAYRHQAQETLKSQHQIDHPESDNSPITSCSQDSNVIGSISPEPPARETNESITTTNQQNLAPPDRSISGMARTSAIRESGDDEARSPQQSNRAQPATSSSRPKRPKSRSEKLCTIVKLFLNWLAKQPDGLDSLYRSSLLEGRDVKVDCDPLLWERTEKATAREIWKPIEPTAGLHAKEIEMLNRAQMSVEQYNVQRRRLTIGFAILVEQNRLDTEHTPPINTGAAQAQILGSIDANKTSYITKCFMEFGWLNQKDRNEWFPVWYRKMCIDALRTWVQGTEGKKVCLDADIKEDLVAPTDG